VSKGTQEQKREVNYSGPGEGGGVQKTKKIRLVQKRTGRRRLLQTTKKEKRVGWKTAERDRRRVETPTRDGGAVGETQGRPNCAGQAKQKVSPQPLTRGKGKKGSQTGRGCRDITGNTSGQRDSFVGRTNMGRE